MRDHRTAVVVCSVALLFATSCAPTERRVPPAAAPPLLAANDDTTCWVPPGDREIYCWGGDRPKRQPSFRVPLQRRPELIAVVDGGVCARFSGAWRCWNKDGPADFAPPDGTDAFSLMNDASCSLRDGTLRCQRGDETVEVQGASHLAHNDVQTCVIASGVVECVSFAATAESHWAALPLVGDETTSKRTAKLVSFSSRSGCVWDGMTVACLRRFVPGPGESLLPFRDVYRSRETTLPGTVLTMVTAGWDHCVLIAGGEVFCGFGTHWRLELEHATALVAGKSHVCAASEDDKMWCWGDNDRGQLHVGNMWRDWFPRPRKVVPGVW